MATHVFYLMLLQQLMSLDLYPCLLCSLWLQKWTISPVIPQRKSWNSGLAFLVEQSLMKVGIEKVVRGESSTKIITKSHLSSYYKSSCVCHFLWHFEGFHHTVHKYSPWHSLKVPIVPLKSSPEFSISQVQKLPGILFFMTISLCCFQIFLWFFLEAWFSLLFYDTKSTFWVLILWTILICLKGNKTILNTEYITLQKDI